MKKQVLVLSHWHTGSGLIAHILSMCGMWLGNQNTSWDKDCIHNTEHNIMNNAATNISIGKDVKINTALIKDILACYIIEARKEGRAVYGIKITHALHKDSWPILSKVFNELWPEAYYVLPIQHPYRIFSILKTRPHSKEWPEKRVMGSWLSCTQGMMAVSEIGTIVDMPSSYFKNMVSIKKLVKQLGLKWNSECDHLFKSARVKRMPAVAGKKFTEKNKEAVQLYKELLRRK